MPGATSSELIGPLLREVARSFYLTLRILPPPIRPQISLAYLLARASDTIADTRAAPRAKRVVALRQLQPLTRAPDLGPLAAGQATPGERHLLARLPDCLELLNAFSEHDARLIQSLLRTIIDGQLFDLERFPGDDESRLTALRDDAELDRYTYLVAGCVGEFWTRICRAHLPALQTWDATVMEAQGVRFGKGLQLVNILRDLPKDLRIGRCYLPVADPAPLLDPANYAQVRDEYHRWLDIALAHLEAGWEYTLAIPPRLGRLRVACVWPIWIGVMTIARLRAANPLDGRQRVKVTRGEVYRLMARSWWSRRNDRALTATFDELKRHG